MRPISETIEAFFARSTIPLSLADARQPDAPLLMVNSSFCSLTGYGMDEIVGRNCRFLQGEDRDQPAREEIRTAIDDGGDCQVILTNYTKDGKRFENLLFLFTLRDGNGEPDMFMGSQFEIRATRPAAQLDLHAHALEAGIDRIATDAGHLSIKTRQLLATSAVGLVRAKLARFPQGSSF
jgi:PAS domain S-box-containing protein